MLILVNNLYPSPLCFLHRNTFFLFHLVKCIRNFLTASKILCTSEENESKQSVTTMEACLIKNEIDKRSGIYIFQDSDPLLLNYA